MPSKKGTGVRGARTGELRSEARGRPAAKHDGHRAGQAAPPLEVEIGAWISESIRL